MAVRNDLDRLHLVSDVIDRVPKLQHIAAYTKQAIRDKLIDHKEYICKYGEDLPESRNWKWHYGRGIVIFFLSTSRAMGSADLLGFSGRVWGLTW